MEKLKILEETTVNEILWKLIYIGLFFLSIIMVMYYIKRKTVGDKPLIKGHEKINNSLSGSNLSRSVSPTGFIFGLQGKKKVFLPNSEEGHISIFGGSGLGKTSALLIPSLRVWEAPFFVIDISGDISKNVPKTRNRVILNPENPYESVIYNVFHNIDIADSSEKKEKLEQLVNLIVDIPAKANDTQLYFLTTARKIFLASMIAFYNIGLDFTEICRTVFFSELKELSELIEATENDLAIGYITPIKNENEKNTAGAKSALNDKIRLFADNEKIIQILKRPITDFDGFTEPCFYPPMIEKTQVFLKVSDQKQEYYAAFMHIVTAQLLEYISGREYDRRKDKRILIALDEFASIGHFEILTPFRKFRKNGANLCILTQSLADVDLVYSDKERQVILDNSQYIVVLSAVENQTKEYFSNMVGKEEKKATSISKGKNGSSTSISSQRDFAIKPEEWKKYAKKDRLVVIHPSGYVVLNKNYYFKGEKKWNRKKKQELEKYSNQQEKK